MKVNSVKASILRFMTYAAVLLAGCRQGRGDDLFPVISTLTSEVRPPADSVPSKKTDSNSVGLKAPNDRGSHVLPGEVVSLVSQLLMTDRSKAQGAREGATDSIAVVSRYTMQQPSVGADQASVTLLMRTVGYLVPDRSSTAATGARRFVERRGELLITYSAALQQSSWTIVEERRPLFVLAAMVALGMNEYQIASDSREKLLSLWKAENGMTAR